MGVSSKKMGYIVWVEQDNTILDGERDVFVINDNFPLANARRTRLQMEYEAREQQEALRAWEQAEVRDTLAESSRAMNNDNDNHARTHTTDEHKGQMDCEQPGAQVKIEPQSPSPNFSSSSSSSSKCQPRIIWIDIRNVDRDTDLFKNVTNA